MAPWHRSEYRNFFTDRQREFLEKLFDLAKEYEDAAVFASGTGGEAKDGIYRVLVEVYLRSRGTL